MAAAAIAAKAAINRKIKKQKEAQLAADLAAGLDPEEEFMKRVMARMEEDNKIELSKWQNPENWSGCFHKYVKFANKMQRLAEDDGFNLFIIGVIIAAGVVVGFQTYAVNDPVYFCKNAMPQRVTRCTDTTSKYIVLLLSLVVAICTILIYILVLMSNFLFLSFFFLFLFFNKKQSVHKTKFLMVGAIFIILILLFRIHTQTYKQFRRQSVLEQQVGLVKQK